MMTELDAVMDEQFCQGFELEALADVVLRNETERWVSGFANIAVETEHTNRYRWASQFVSGKKVLDIACGSGKGSNILAKEGQAKKVVGCDIDSKAIRYASIRNKHENISFVANDAQRFDDGEKYDVIISFETIEHIPDVEAYLTRMKSLLAEHGSFYVSTPISCRDLDSTPLNPFHLREWGFRPFQKLLGKYFSIEQIYVQLCYQLVVPNFPFLRKGARLYTALKQRLPLPERSASDSYIMKPAEYDRVRFPEKDLGKSYTGYQILKCSKLP
jgi:2-polyprenyl-3-methyl-5-hydroxy-6-metoxy-1,4-benzoquinol methylase